MNTDRSKQSGSKLEYHGKEELESIEKDLIFYNKFLVRKFLSECNTKLSSQANYKILDFGAGIGTLAEIWFKNSSGSKPICLEIDEDQRTEIRKKGFLAVKSLSELSHKIEFVYTSNVLEHIEDDVQALSDLCNSLSDNGTLVIYVPAFQILFSDLDRKVGHYRRYQKRELKSKLRNSGFKIEKIEYVDSIGFFAAFAIRLLGWRELGNLGNSRSLRFYDKFIFPISKSMDFIGFKYLFGKNLYVVGRKAV